MKHFREASRAAEEVIQRHEDVLDRAVLVDDVFGRIRVIVWLRPEAPSGVADHLRAALEEAAGVFWAGDLWVASGASSADLAVYDTAWEEGAEITTKLRRSSRRRTRGFWLDPPDERAWALPEEGGGTPIVSFYSFRGGVGRTTALALFAIRRARKGERLAVLDLDFNAPGAGTLLAPSEISEQWP